MGAHEIKIQMEQLKTEFRRMKDKVKEAGDRWEEFQETVADLEDQFGMFRRMYFRLEDDVKKLVDPAPSGALDDTAILPPSMKPDSSK